MKIKAVIFDLDLIDLLNSKDNQFDWFVRHGDIVDGKLVAIKTILIDSPATNRKQRLPEYIWPDFVGSARMAEKFLEDTGIKPENTLFVSDNEKHVELCHERYRTVLLKPHSPKNSGMKNGASCQPRYRAYDFDGLTRIVNLIEWKEGE